MEEVVGGISAIITATVAYRIQPPQGGFNFKIGATPYFAPTTGTLMIWGGISAGFWVLNIIKQPKPLQKHI